MTMEDSVRLDLDGAADTDAATYTTAADAAAVVTDSNHDDHRVGNDQSVREILEEEMNHDSGVACSEGSEKSPIQDCTDSNSQCSKTKMMEGLDHDSGSQNLDGVSNSEIKPSISQEGVKTITLEEKRDKPGQEIAGESTSELNEERCEKVNLSGEDSKRPCSSENEGRDDCLSVSGNVQDNTTTGKLKTDMMISEEGKTNYNQSHSKPSARRPSSPSSSVANRSVRSTRSRKSQRRTPAKQKSAQFIPLKSTPSSDGRASLLTRGISLFGRSTKQMSYAKSSDNDDANSVVSELSRETKSEKPASTATFDRNNDDTLRQHLEEAGLVLLKRLIEFLSECPPSPEERSFQSTPSKPKKKRGLTLPASAIGWLSSQMADSCNDALEGIADCYQIPKQQLECLRPLFKRVTSLRISGEAWPPPHASTVKAASDATGAAKSGISSRLLSKFAGDQSLGGDSLDDESCATAPSLVGAEIAVSAFQRYYHELQYNPDVNMSFFPNATKVVMDGIPPNWVTNLDSLQSMDLFQMEKGCIIDVNQLFFPSDISSKHTTANVVNQNNSHGLRRDLSLIDEGKAKDASQSLSDDDGAGSSSKCPVVYSHLSKLRLSNCAMGEAAGLRGRATSKSIPRLPTFSRFPNLVSLNLSQNELFKTKTVFAGLSTLPLLSSINLSYNRLSRMDDIFMYIGNVTELILTGNEISSTRGLDRLFSLERLSLDENKIQNLSSIAGVAKIPFLMNFDLKGNPLESDDPASCRVKVFNLFREVRCNNLPKDATFRDMQRLLPILDKELATKDELIALKDLTYRQTVISVDTILPPESQDGCMDANNIDETSEISLNMPDTTGGIRRIGKSSLTNTAHFRIAGSVSLDERAASRLERFHGGVDSRIERREQKKQLGVKFNLNDLVSSIRPQIDISDTSTHKERDSGMTKKWSFTSHRSEHKDDNINAMSTATDFPFSLPPALLAEASDDVWNSPTLLDQIVPSDTIVWEAMSRDNIEQGDADGLEEKNEALQSDDEPSNPPDDIVIEINGTDSLNAASDDETQLPSPSLGQESEGEVGDAIDPGDANEETADSKPRKSMFDDIWEQSYRDNVTRNKEDVSELNDSTNTNASELLDFNTAEQSSHYDGPSDYGSLYVSSDLDLYFDSYIFHRESSDDDLQETRPRGGIMAPRIQLFKFDRDLLINRKRQHDTVLRSTTDFREQYIGVWKENVLACGSCARSRLAPIKTPKRGFHGDTISQGGKDVLISESRKFIICLTDSALYFIVDDDSHESTGEERTFPSRIPPNSTFSDAYWPHAVVRHPLDCLRGITIGFQFQCLILRFCVGSAASPSSLEYTYVVLTSNKLQTVSFLQKIQSHVTDAQIGMGALIDNDDKIFLDALGATRSNEDVIHYQILHQIWKRGDREASQRAFVLTDSKVYLLDETYTGDGTKPEGEKDKSKKLGDISFAIIDSARLSRVTEVRAANEDPRKITLVILPQSKLKRSHRWRLVCNDGEGAERLIDDVRKAMAALA